MLASFISVTVLISVWYSQHSFTKEQNHELADRFYDDNWIAKLLFLPDIFSHIDQLNSSMQEKEKLFYSIDPFKKC